jgi:dCMP deaminase
MKSCIECQATEEECDDCVDYTLYKKDKKENLMRRPTWKEYFMKMAILASTRGTCDRKYVGAVIVKDNNCIATGYNGSIIGQPHCSGPKKYTECSNCGHIMEWTSDNEDEMRTMFSCPKCNLLSTLKIKESAGHTMVNGGCQRTVHAECNALVQAAKRGVSVDGAEIFVTCSPCWNCFKMIANAGIKTIYYNELYREQTVFEVAGEVGISLIQVKLDGPGTP